jgi:hypothetical protein
VDDTDDTDAPTVDDTDDTDAPTVDDTDDTDALVVDDTELVETDMFSGDTFLPDDLDTSRQDTETGFTWTIPETGPFGGLFIDSDTSDTSTPLGPLPNVFSPPSRPIDLFPFP